MPSSFDSFHDETRPLAMLEEPAAARPRPGVVLASLLLIVLPVLAAVLL